LNGSQRQRCACPRKPWRDLRPLFLPPNSPGGGWVSPRRSGTGAEPPPGGDQGFQRAAWGSTFKLLLTATERVRRTDRQDPGAANYGGARGDPDRRRQETGGPWRRGWWPLQGSDGAGDGPAGRGVERFADESEGWWGRCCSTDDAAQRTATRVGRCGSFRRGDVRVV